MILQRSDREQLQAIAGCLKLGIPWRFSRDVGPARICHVGTVEWCEIAMGWHPEPDYYPGWLAEWRRRDIWVPFDVDEAWKQPVFAKPSSGYKIAEARIIPQGELVPAGWWISQVVTFTTQWRYYVAAGEVLAAGWYDGNNENEPAPRLAIEWPKGWCGAADFGRLYPSGEIALVECHHPYACGNYLETDECELWAMWLQLGWEWMLANAS